MRSRLCWVALLAGCERDLVKDLPDAPARDGAPDAPPSHDAMTLHGVGSVYYRTEAPLVAVPQDFSASLFASITPVGDTVDRRTGTGGADGTFALDVGKDAARWTLGYASSPVASFVFTVGNATMPDLSYVLLGRPDARAPLQNTHAILDVTGLAPWGALDDLQILSINAGAIVFSPQAAFAIPANATVIAGERVPWTTNLVEAARGDVAQLVHLTTRTTTTPYAAIAQVGTATGFTQTAGSDATFSVALVDVPQDQTLSVKWQRSQFEALRPSGAGPGVGTLFVDALPGLLAHGGAITSPDLVKVDALAGATDVDLALTYGNPWPTWDQFILLDHFFDCSASAPGATMPAVYRCGYESLVSLASLPADHVLVPRVAAVRDLTVGGRDALVAQAGVGSTPVIAWTAPAIGAPTSYGIAVDELVDAGGATITHARGVFFTKQTSFTLPDGLIVAGGAYSLLVTSFVMPGVDLTVAPFARSAEIATFTIASGVFQP